MTGTACLAIGVGDAPPLDYLRGAINGAHAVTAWAHEHQFEARVLTDEHDPVERGDVTAALEELLATTPEALVLYFAGHGLSRAAGEDLWLLSRWQEEERAVSIAGLRDRLWRYGLKRLILVSDACRSPVDANTQTVEGDSLLGRGPFDDEQPQIDQWYASSRGRAAFMIPGDTPESTRCIFSGLFTEALAGGHVAAYDTTDPQRPITSFSLADFMEVEVAMRAARYGATLKPAITTSIRPPRNRYRDSPPTKPPALAPWPDPQSAALAAMGTMDAATRITPPEGASWSTRATGMTMPAAPPAYSNLPPPSPSWDVTLSAAPSRSGCAPQGLYMAVGALGVIAAIAILAVYFLMARSAPSIPVHPSGGIENPAELQIVGGTPIELVAVGVALIFGYVAYRWLRLYPKSVATAPSDSTEWLGPAMAPTPAMPAAFVEVTLEAIAAEDAIRGARADAIDQNRIDATLKGFGAENRPDHFETGAGLVLSGATASKVVVGPHAQAELFEDGRIARLNLPDSGDGGPWWDGSIPLKHPLPALVEFATGDWVGTAVLPQYVLSLGIGSRGAETALYRRMFDHAPPEAEEVMARLAASGLAGDQTIDVVTALRAGKHANPMMGVLAAWLHHGVGDFDNIRRTAYYFAKAHEAVPFDIALLGRFEATRGVDGIVRIAIPAAEEGSGRALQPEYLRAATPAAEAVLAGAFPLMRQGWPLLDPEGRGNLYPEGLAALSRHLRPAPFTTLSPEGGRALAKLIFPASGD